jgi:hypothetical protein
VVVLVKVFQVLRDTFLVRCDLDWDAVQKPLNVSTRYFAKLIGILLSGLYAGLAGARRNGYTFFS